MNPEVLIEKSFGPINFTPKSVSVQHTITGKLVKILASKTIAPKLSRGRLVPPDVQEKINYNRICSEKWTIIKYADYGEAIENAYAQVEIEVINGKAKALTKLNDLYYQALAEFNINFDEFDIQIIREHSDAIFKRVSSSLRNYLLENDSSLAQLSHEELDTGVNLVVAHGFVECLVLEGPQ